MMRDVVLKGLIYDRLRVFSPPWLRRWVKNRSWFVPLSRRMFGSEVYSRSYFQDIERLEAGSVVHMAGWVMSELRPPPRRVIDVGCGPGHLMAALRERGADVFGVDISREALRACREKGLNVEHFDLTAPGVPLPGAPYDLAISCEVAEHLDERYADLFVEKLTAAAPRVLLTAAEPDTGVGPGLHHVNERPHAYWVARMEARGFRLDRSATDSLRAYLDRPEVIGYLRRPMVFVAGPAREGKQD
jgi:SAM-dependent methyltransferase